MANQVEKEMPRGPISYVFLTLIVVGLLLIGGLLGYLHFRSRYHAHADLCVESLERFQYPYLGVYVVSTPNDTVWKVGDQLVLEDTEAYMMPIGTLFPLHDDDYGKWHVDWNNTHGICGEEHTHEE